MKRVVSNAAATQSRAMEPETISKNRASLKSHTSRRNSLRKTYSALFFAIIATFVLSSCSSLQRTTSVKTIDITNVGVIQKPVIVDLVVDQTKVRGTATGSNTSGGVTVVKSEAVKDALSKAGQADVLIEPDFTITTRNANITVEVTGFPATYKNFRTIEEQDAVWLENSQNIYIAKTYDPTEKKEVTTDQKKKGIIWSAAGTVTAVLLLLLFL